MIGVVAGGITIIFSLVLLIFTGAGDHASSYRIFILAGSIVFGCGLISEAIVKQVKSKQ